MNLEFFVWFAILVVVGVGALVWMAIGELAEIEPLPDDWAGPGDAAAGDAPGQREPPRTGSGGSGRADA